MMVSPLVGKGSMGQLMTDPDDATLDLYLPKIVSSDRE